MKSVMLFWGMALLLTSGSASPMVLDYPISLFSDDYQLSTVLWLRPAFCLYELWHRNALDPTQASHRTATVEVEVKPAGANNTYKISQLFPVPVCVPIIDQFLLTEGFAYAMGPTLACLNDTCTKTVLPGRGYSVRYLLYNQAHTQLVVTEWSEPFHTRGIPHSYRSIDVGAEKLSSEAVVVIVLLSISMFLLLAAIWAALSKQ